MTFHAISFDYKSYLIDQIPRSIKIILSLLHHPIPRHILLSSLSVSPVKINLFLCLRLESYFVTNFHKILVSLFVYIAIPIFLPQL